MFIPVETATPPHSNPVFIKLLVQSNGIPDREEYARGVFDPRSGWKVFIPIIFEFPYNYFDGDFEVIGWMNIPAMVKAVESEEYRLLKKVRI